MRPSSRRFRDGEGGEDRSSGGSLRLLLGRLAMVNPSLGTKIRAAIKEVCVWRVGDAKKLTDPATLVADW